MRAGHSLVGFLCVLLAFSPARTQEPDATPPAGTPQLTITVHTSRVELRGVVSSVAHELIIQQTMTNFFAEKEALYELEVRPALAPGWALVTEITLRSLAATRSATAQISDSEIVIRGIAASTADWNEAAARIERNLLPGMTFQHEVVEIPMSGSMNRQCLELFRTAKRGRKIEFPRASATLGTSASPLLDELLQIAVDCPATHIEIIGHTDSTGDETVNQALSQARANAVSGYLVAGGLAAERITATGKGSSEPLVGEDSSQARQLNRRIDIELRFP